MSKKVIKNRNRHCSACGAESGILTISLPSDQFLRPRTEPEADLLEVKRKTGTLNPSDMRMDRVNRKVGLCPECIKPAQKKFGTQNVGLWGHTAKGQK